MSVSRETLSTDRGYRMENVYKVLDTYLDKIIETNTRINLTRITDKQEGRLLHLEDSLAVLIEMNEAPEGIYGDLGTGGGFPGVPLGIITGRETLLIDSVKKKITVIEDILKDLELDEKISTYNGRIEELALEKPGEFSVLTARALSSLPSLIELASPLLCKGGHLICLKANIEVSEIGAAQVIEDKVGMRLIKDREYDLSDHETHRRVLVFEKYKEPSLTLPRRIGMAQKRPLK